MPDEVNTQNTDTSSDGAWRTELPEAMRSHEAFAPYKSKSELWEGVTKLHTEHKAAAQKVTDLEAKLKDAIPKLPADATQEERDLYFNELGRPEKPEEYELDGEDKNAVEWNKQVKETMHKLGISKDAATGLSKWFNSVMQQMVEAHNAKIKTEIEQAGTKLKAEYGDKYDANIELAKRMWQKYGDNGDFDKQFSGETTATRFAMVKYLINVAKMTGEDTVPQGKLSSTKATEDIGNWFPNSPKSPTGK